MSLNNLNLTTDFSVSRIIHGQMRLKDWELSKKKLITFVGKLNRSKGYDLFGNAVIKILEKYQNIN